MNSVYSCNLDNNIITRDNPIYDEIRQEWNKSIQKYPIAIIYCNNYKDVSNAILWSTCNKVPLRIRSHGHNYEGFSTGTNVLVIDISNINDICIDSVKNIVRVGAGVNLSTFYNTIADEGYVFPGGTCPTVGVSGFSLGGGWGLSSRKFGLGCDSIIEIEMINYKGELLVINENIYPDLFWAMKGAGGGNFGVVVSITFKLPDKVTYVTQFDINYSNIDFCNQVELFDIFQYWITKTSTDINVKISIIHKDNFNIYAKIIGICYKSVVDTVNLLTPFLDIYGATISLKYVTFKDAVNDIFTNYPSYDYFQSPGKFVNRYLYKYEISNFLSIINTPKPEGSLITEVAIYGLGGKVSAPSKYDTAFYYRDSYYILLYQTSFENNNYKSVNNDWILENYPLLSNISHGSYINFPYIGTPNYKTEYFGENTYKLECIKKKYDPYNIFKFPQSL